jgi:hypothetical protein
MLERLINDRSTLTPVKWEKEKLTVYPTLVRGWRCWAGDVSDDLDQLLRAVQQHIERLLPLRFMLKESRGPAKHTASRDRDLESRIRAGAKLKPSVRDTFAQQHSTHIRRVQRHRKQERDEAARDEAERIALQSPWSEAEGDISPPDFLAHI